MSPFPLFHSPRFWVPALVAVGAVALVAFAVGRGSSKDGQAPADAGVLDATDVPPPPAEFPPPGPEAEAAAAIDGLLSRGARHLEEESLEAAAEVFERAMQDSRKAGDHGRRVRSALGRAEALARLGREPEALDLAASARREGPADPPSVDALRLAGLESALLLGAGRPLEAAPVAREALDDADRHHPGDVDLRDLLVSALADALAAASGFAEAARLVDEHLARVEVGAVLDAGQRAGWLDRAGRLHGAAGSFDLSVARLEKSLDALVEAGSADPLPAAVTRISLAASLFDAGHPVQARAEAVQAHAVLSAALPPDDPERKRLADIAARIGAEVPEPGL
jgi:tetratricopeptide (TPR) repeat protein